MLFIFKHVIYVLKFPNVWGFLLPLLFSNCITAVSVAHTVSVENYCDLEHGKVIAVLMPEKSTYSPILE